jgi:hypothetical protein
MKEEEKLFKSNRGLLNGYDFSFDFYEFLQSGVNTRLAIFKRYRNRKLENATYCIVWSDGFDLTKLDKKVESNCFNDEDFSCSIKTHVQRVFCKDCKSEYMGLIADSSDIYIVQPENNYLDYRSVFELIKNKINKYRFKKCLNNQFDYGLGLELLDNKLKKYNFKKCPNCNSPFTIYVAKILYKCEDKKFTW